MLTGCKNTNAKNKTDFRCGAFSLCAALAAFSICTANAETDSRTAAGGRVTIFPSKYHQSEFDGDIAAIGVDTAYLKYEDFFSGHAFDGLSDSDIVAVPPLFNYSGEFAKIPTNIVGSLFGRLRDWLKDGGILFLPDANYPFPMCNDWLSELDPSLVLLKKDSECGCRMPSATTPAEETFGPFELGDGLSWNHLVFTNPADWTTLSTCGHGNATAAVRKYGKGLVVYSVLRQNYAEYFCNLLRIRFKNVHGLDPTPADGTIFATPPARPPKTPACTADTRELRNGMIELSIRPENLSAMPPVDVIIGAYRLLCELRAKNPSAVIVIRELRGETKDEITAAATVNREIAKFTDGESTLWLGKGIQPRAPKTHSRILDEGYGSHNWWLSRLQRNRREILASGGTFDIVLLGDSITQNWEAPGAKKLAELKQKYTVLSAGYSGDTVPTLRWRVENGELDGFTAKIIMVMIGTNDAQWTPGGTPESIAKEICELVTVIRRKQPDAKIIVSSVFPRGEKPDDPLRLKVAAINQNLDGIADGKTVFFTDFAKAFISADGTITKSLMPDFLHPGSVGYDAWFDALQTYLP